MVCQFGDITNSSSLGSAKDSFSSVKTLRNLRYVKYAGLTAWLLALIFIILINVSRSYASNQSDQAGAEAGLSTLATTVTGQAKVGMSDPGDVGLSAIAEGGIVTGGHNLTVSSTSVAGYKVAMESDGALKDDSFAGSESTNNTLIMSTTGGTLTTPAPLTNNSWGVAIVGNSGFDDVAVYQSTDQSVLSKAKFAPIPGRSGDNPDGQVIFSGNAATTGDTRAIYYGVKTDPYFRAGNYSTTVVYTITAELPDTPTITSVTPDSYQLESGASGQITIEGANLSSAYSVYLTNASGDTVGDCTNLNVVDDTQLTCTILTTGISAGDYTIHVVTQGGEAPIGFTYTEKPKPAGTVCTNADSQSACRVDIDAKMIPIRYDGNNSDGSARWLTVSNDEVNNNKGIWYNYEAKQWANAVTVEADKLSTYQNKSSVEINNDDVLGYWVYVPRYAYEVMRPNATDRVVAEQNFDIRFETTGSPKKTPAASCNIADPSMQQMWRNGTPTANAGPDNANILAKDYRTGCHPNDRGYPGDDETLSNGKTTWATHPAFSWDGTELNGIWIGKFEMTGSRTNPTVKPNEHANINEDIGVFYTMAKSIAYNDPNNTGGNSVSGLATNKHGLSASTKSHMVRNSDWGAAVYLTASVYGAGYDGVIPNVAVTTSSDADNQSADSGITGCGPNSSSSTKSYSGGTKLNSSTTSSLTACSSDKERSYNGSIGVLSSTTGNAYGIYDMSGGAFEYVMGNFTTIGSTTEPDDQRPDAFTSQIGAPYADLYYAGIGYGLFAMNDYNFLPYWADVGIINYEGNALNINVCTWGKCGGQAVHETTSAQLVGKPEDNSMLVLESWNKNASNFGNGDSVWPMRGGNARGDGEEAGVFSLNALPGIRGDAWSEAGARAALVKR